MPSTRTEYLVDPGWGAERERLALLCPMFLEPAGAVVSVRARKGAVA